MSGGRGVADRVTGETLHREVAEAAKRSRQTITAFAKPLWKYATWTRLEQLRIAKSPKPETVERIRHFIATGEVREAAPAEGPSRNAVEEARRIEQAASATERVEEARAEARVVHATRRPGETLAEAVAREAREREDRFRNATRLTTMHPLPATADEDPEGDLGQMTVDRRERELEELETPSSVLRRAQRDWPDQCSKVKAIAGELGVTLGEAWRMVISAGVDCLSDPEAV